MTESADRSPTRPAVAATFDTEAEEGPFANQIQVTEEFFVSGA